MPDLDDDTVPRMMQTGPHSFVQWDTARRLGLSEWAPEIQVFAVVDKARRENRANLGGLERAAAIINEECPVAPVQAVPAPEPIVVPTAPKRRGRPPKRPLNEILDEAERNRAGPGPGRPRMHGG